MKSINRNWDFAASINAYYTLEPKLRIKIGMFFPWRNLIADLVEEL